MASSTTSLPNANEQQSSPISHLSTINVSNFVSSKLNGDKKSNNYSSWKKQMLCLIESQDLLPFVNGQIHPREQDSIIRRTDRLVMGWILGVLGDSVLKIVADLSNARDVWLELEKVFGDPAGQVQQEAGKEWHDHLELYRAALEGDWSKAKALLEVDPDAVEARLNSNLQTTLHIAAGAENAIDFVKELVDFMPDDLLGLKDYLGFTALHVAAQSGNAKAAKILVDRRPDLLHEPNNGGEFPVHIAALSEQIETLEYFIFGTEDESPYLGETSGIKLLCILIDNSIFDIALHLAERYPYLATVRLKDGNCALKRIALQKVAFCRDPIVRWFYNDRGDRTPMNTGDIEGSIRSENGKHADSLPWFKSLYDRLLYVAYRITSEMCLGWFYIYPAWINQRHTRAIKLVKCLCKNMESLDYHKASAIYEDAILTAASLGIYEVIEEIVATFPAAIYTRDIYSKQSIFHLAAENRHRRVFDFINQTTSLRHQMTDMTDSHGNTFLHLAARFGSSQRNNLYNEALQLHHEILWYRIDMSKGNSSPDLVRPNRCNEGQVGFEEIESFFSPHLRAKENDAGKTAMTVFTEEHATLKAEGKKWVKRTAQACSIVAALIATVTFAAVVTVPGGNHGGTGLPLFSHKSSYKAFTWFNIISFFTSMTSLFLFLSTNITFYASSQRLQSLLLIRNPILNLCILFTSVISMMGAFIAAIHLQINDQNAIIVFSVLLLYILFPAYFFLPKYIRFTMTLVKLKTTLSFKI